MGGIVLTDRRDLVYTVIDALEAQGAPYTMLREGLSGEDAAELAADADVLIIGILPFPRPAIEKLGPGVGLMIRCGIGVDVIDVEAATERGVWVGNIPDYCVEEVADQAMLVMLGASRAARHFQAEMARGRWSQLDYPPVRRLRGQTIGIVGLGRIGSRVALRAHGFGLNVIATDPYIPPERFAEFGARHVELPELLATADIVSLHTPLNAETRHLLDGDAFARMRQGVIVVNVSRGPLIETAALDHALESGKVAAAGLDVIEGEPTPDYGQRIFARPNVFMTPHVAWYSHDARREMGEKAAADALRYLRGERPVNLVNPGARSAPGR